MVRRALPASRFFIYVTRVTQIGERGAGEEQVDAQSMVAPEPGHAVLPPTETLVWLQKFALHVTQSEMQKPPARRLRDAGSMAGGTKCAAKTEERVAARGLEPVSHSAAARFNA